MIVRAWCATFNNARPHEERLECEALLSRQEWLRVATTTTKICAELWKTPFAQLLQKCSDLCHRGHGGASVCVSSIKVHVRIHWTCNKAYVSDSNQIVVAYWSVYGDFSPTLYNYFRGFTTDRETILCTHALKCFFAEVPRIF